MSLVIRTSAAAPEVCAAVAFLVNGEKKKADWAYAKKMLANPRAFISRLTEFDASYVFSNSEFERIFSSF